MSLSALIYASAPATPQQALAAAFPSADIKVESRGYLVELEWLYAVASCRTDPDFTLELYGIDHRVEIYVNLDKHHAGDARRQFAAAVREFVAKSDGDVVVVYLDQVALKRIGASCVYARTYQDMVPSLEGWEMRESLGT